MKLTRRMILMLAMAVMGMSCDHKPSPASSDTEAAKLRPEVAAAQKGISPTPFPQPAAGSTQAP